MKRFFASRMLWLLPAVLMIGLSTARSQAIAKVEFQLPSLDYDVIYLGDFIDITSNKLAKSIPNFSGTIMAFDANGQPVNGKIILTVKAEIQLAGDNQPYTLVTAQTNAFPVNGSRTLSANDLAGGVSDIDVPVYTEYKEQRQRIEDYAKKFPTAPVGQYMFTLTAFDPTSGINGRPLGTVRKVITVRNASPDEVQVNLIDPQPGAIISSTLPTFSWNSPNPKVTLYVFEKLPVHQSPQEAINGIPYLKLDLEGQQTVTYPTNAQRRLEQNKTYVWFVETAVSTNRQTVQKRSEVRMFRIQTENQTNRTVEDLMTNLGSTVSGTFSTLQSIGWQPSGRISLDGKTISPEDLKALVAKLAANNTQVNVRIE